MINETHFLKKLESITLSTAKKSRMRENLVAYAEMHPLVQTISTASPYNFIFAFMEVKRFPLYASLMSVMPPPVISKTDIRLAYSGKRFTSIKANMKLYGDAVDIV